MDFKNKKILVTGGAGFIGSHLADALIERGAKVSIIDNLSTGQKSNLNQKANFYQINIADKKVEEVFAKEKPEIIYHFAFNVLVPESVKNPLMDMYGVIGSVNLFSNAHKYGTKKVIFTSSGFVYGNNKNLPVKETEPMEPVSPYAIAKHTVENYLKFFNKAYGLPYIIFRNSSVYGARQITGAMADYIKKLTSGQQAEIWGDGEKTRDYIYIDDVVKANLLAADLPDNFEDPVFNIGTGKETTLNHLYKKIADLLGKEPKPIHHDDRPGEQIRYCLENSKAKKALGWNVNYNLDEGLNLLLKSQGLIK
jgi:UDP-glucose 4-epimerase